MAGSIKKTTLFALVLAFVLAMAFSFSAVKNTAYAQTNEIVINGITYNSTINQKGQNWNWNASTKTLTLNNFRSEAGKRPIWIKCANEDDKITINLIGQNIIDVPSGDGSIRLGDLRGNNPQKAEYTFKGAEGSSLGITNYRPGQGNYTVAYWLTGEGSTVRFDGGEYWTHIEGNYSPCVVYCDSSSQNGHVEIAGGRFNASVKCGNASETAMVFKNAISLDLKQFDFMWLEVSNTADAAKAQLFNCTVSMSGLGSEVQTAAGTLSKSSKMFRGTKLAYFTRIFGKSRYDTALNVAQARSEAKGRYAVQTVVVASGDNYPDALGGGYLAKINDAPLILVSKTTEAKILKHIEDEGYSKVYILGGVNAVSQNFEDKCKDLDEDMYVRRLSGATRYETNIAILHEAGVDKSTFYDDILLCNGKGFADSLSASGTGKPILLVDGKTLNVAQKKLIGDCGTRNFYVIGGQSVMSDEYSKYITKTYNDCSVDRVAGATRYQTSVAVAEQFSKGTHNNVVLAYAQNFPDGLSGGPLALAYNAPLILVDSSHTADAKAYAKAHNSMRVIVLGGPSLISDAAALSIRS